MHAVVFTLLFSTLSLANEEVEKQKTTIKDVTTKLGLKTAPVIETTDGLVVTTIVEAKAKTLAETVQKTIDVAKLNQKVAKDESPFGGKVTLYAFSDNGELRKYLRLIEQRRSESETHVLNIRGNQPVILVSLDPGAKVNEAELTNLAAIWSAAAVLNKKAGAGEAKIPDWLLAGYGRACLIRSEPAAKQGPVRAKIRTAVLGRKNPVWAKDIWGDAKMPERDLMAASFVEYLAFGPLNEKFLAFVRGTKPLLDQDNPPTPEAAAQAAYEMKIEDLDAAWKQWVIKGK